MEIPSRMTYLGIYKQDYLITQINIPPLHIDISMVVFMDFDIEEVILGNPTKDSAHALATLKIKYMFTEIDKGEQEI